MLLKCKAFYISIIFAPLPLAKSDKSLVFLGGESTNHWRTGYYDGNKFYVYDSIHGYTDGKLVTKELNYILRRFPDLTENDVHFIRIKSQQPDGNSCGIYVSALATCIVLHANPADILLATDVSTMRKHFWEILKTQKLSLFPTLN